jgi:hypothetical protein
MAETRQGGEPVEEYVDRPEEDDHNVTVQVRHGPPAHAPWLAVLACAARRSHSPVIPSGDPACGYRMVLPAGQRPR